ncbi:MAG: hypothetical protein ACRYG8_46455 [Janthinobacterium lividum]
MPRISLLAGVSCAALAMLSAAHAQTVPVRASTFLNSLGVNTHLGDLDTSWGVRNGKWAPDEAKVLAELKFLGFPNIRDAVPQGQIPAEMNDLARAGFKFDLLQVDEKGVPRIAADIAQIAAQMQAVPGSVISVEASNEYNNADYSLGGVSSRNNLAWGAIVNKATRAALKANPITAGVPLVAASTSNISSAPSIGGSADHSNWHVYSNMGQQLAVNLKGAVAAARATLPGQPVEITETGISSGAASISSWGNAGDEYTQGLIVTNTVLDAFNDGAVHTYLYDLMDERADTTSIENMFGLFHTDGTAKAAANDLHNLTTVLADASAAAASFTPSAPGFALPTLPAGASSLLLQKASGAYDLVLWNSSLPVWPGTARVTPTPVAVTMPLAGTYTSVKVYDVVTGATPTQTLSGVSSVSLSLGKEPMVIEIAGLVPPVVPANSPRPGL